MVNFGIPNSYTEATHTVYADVSGADPLEVSGDSRRWFIPTRITVTYSWRTQLNETGWVVSGMQVSGPWVQIEGAMPRPGSGVLVFYPAIAPDWVNDFAAIHSPDAIKLVGAQPRPYPL